MYTNPKNYPENNPTQIQTLKSDKYNILNNEKNVQHVQRERQVLTNISDFGSTFKKFPESHEKFYGMTSYQQAFSRPIKETAKQVIEIQEKKNNFAGTNERPLNQQCSKMTSVLTGEKYKNEQDPKDNTSIQRAWLPYYDKALQVAEKNLQINNQINQSKGFQPKDQLQTYKTNLNQVFKRDITTSLPIGDGEHANQIRLNIPGEYRHFRTDVTLVRNKTFTKK
ncbi:hypothetical protein IMG5_079140 [Ichthyophthirius multifiliis]|uniref:Uncharacterized protein n=1 Tax=Ichthyophthirius multifiliis TaxID=5932 RepID=G0QQH7_ICHMU|nr:hypothetical protein IMG5_079140 [Ichthyophthirius multifiliis]EGR32527.1 hypothetical protein IMG5_079140 [Ichthyophthirius multifiliis]|eukprot:XP_004036513.1 hypothetical protein IMG5_079140 [Ichthyophthirius multifiliis]